MMNSSKLLATINNQQYQVQKTLNQILHNDDSQLSTISNESEQSVPLISIPTSEFCSLNMRLLERNNEVKLAMETASKAEAKLIEYRKSADKAMQQLKQELIRCSVQNISPNNIDNHNVTIEQLQEENIMLKEHNKLLTTQIDDDNNNNNNNNNNEDIINKQKIEIEKQKDEINRLQKLLGNLAQIKRRNHRNHREVYNKINNFNKSFKKYSNDIKSLLQNNSIFKLNINKIEMSIKKCIKNENNYIISKYIKEKKLRKLYYNELIELRGNIRVYCRIRPILENEINNGYNDIISYDDNDDDIIHIYDEERLMTLSFEFDKIFNNKNTKQIDIFNEISPLLLSVIDGYNVCIFAYGQTGAGKTYTMQGPKDNPGVNLRTISLLFDKLNKNSKEMEYEYKIKISLLQVYNETIIDLLNNDKKSLKPILTKEGKVIIPGLLLKTVTTETEVIKMLNIGIKNRTTAITNMNQNSSRSHLILSIYSNGKNKINNKNIIESKLHLIDLAGSERNKKSGAKGKTMKEAININSSLSALSDVIQAKFNKSKHIPFRRSILTYLLKDSLEKDSKTAMIVCCSCTNRDVTESSCSLKFASRVKKVELGNSSNKARKFRNKNS